MDFITDRNFGENRLTTGKFNFRRIFVSIPERIPAELKMEMCVDCC